MLKHSVRVKIPIFEISAAYNFGTKENMPNEYDRVIHENFEGLTMAVLKRMPNVEVIEVVPMQRKVQRTLEKERDWLLKIRLSGFDSLLNAEWQVNNDPEMSLRILLPANRFNNA
ncbi:MAG: hypothetical protein J7497_07660 [Chitinophagaceae bacterium]|nr:hypothetical protein [Chitinophagaceae bacterium]